MDDSDTRVHFRTKSAWAGLIVTVSDRFRNKLSRLPLASRSANNVQSRLNCLTNSVVFYGKSSSVY
jgi:hypothetical protein